MPIIKLSNVARSYRGKPVLRGITATLSPEQGMCIFGPEGVGKTVLLRLVAGLEAPDDGVVTVDDVPATAGDPHTRGIGMVFQNFALWPHLSVEKHLRFVLGAQEIPREEAAQRIERMLTLSGLTEERRSKPAALSKDQQQRLSLARALIVHPRLLLLDEPFMHLEGQVRRHFIEEILRRRSADHTSVIVATRQYEEALPIVDKILHLETETYRIEDL